MANNRMYLGHVDAGICILLGKRMSHGYYKPCTSQELLNFYEKCALLSYVIDDFILFDESSKLWGQDNTNMYHGHRRLLSEFTEKPSELDTEE